MLDLVAAVREAVGVWYNITGTQTCFRIGETDEEQNGDKEGSVHKPDNAALRPGGVVRTKTKVLRAAAARSMRADQAAEMVAEVEVEVEAAEAADVADAPPPCASCPPCPGCPACPIATCARGICHHKAPLSKTFSWTAVTCNEE